MKQNTENSTLSISSPSISNCREVAEYFLGRQIPCDVTENVTVAPQPPSKHHSENECQLEIGCRVRFHEHNPSLFHPIFWSQLKEHFGLTCAHLDINGKFKGCIYDYFRNSSCPGNIQCSSDMKGMEKGTT